MSVIPCGLRGHAERATEQLDGNGDVTPCRMLASLLVGVLVLI
jgi:hypothetical protein